MKKGSEIMNELLQREGINPNQLAEKIGLKRTQPIYDILSGKIKKISENYADKILLAFPEYRKVWILTGDGNMLNAPPDSPKERRRHYLYMLFDKLQMNPQEFSKSIGLESPDKLYQVLRGEKRMGGYLADLISTVYPDISDEWILTGLGDMIKINAADIAVEILTGLGDKIAKEISTGLGDKIAKEISTQFGDKIDKELARFLAEKRLPLYDISDYSYCYSFDDIFRYEKVVGEYKFPYLEEADWMILIKDNSMAPKYSIGDSIACQVVYRRILPNNSVYVIASRIHGILVRRLKKTEKDDIFLAVPDNNEFDTLEVSFKDIVGCAEIVGVIKDELFIEKETSALIFKKTDETGEIMLSEIIKICRDNGARYNIVLRNIDYCFDAIGENEKYLDAVGENEIDFFGGNEIKFDEIEGNKTKYKLNKEGLQYVNYLKNIKKGDGLLFPSNVPMDDDVYYSTLDLIKASNDDINRVSLARQDGHPE